MFKFNTLLNLKLSYIRTVLAQAIIVLKTYF